MCCIVADQARNITVAGVVGLGPKGGARAMSETILDRANDYLAESAERAFCAKIAVAGAIEDGIGTVKHAAKRGRLFAEEAVDHTAQTIKRNPVKAVAASLAVGLIAGTLVGWKLRRR